MEKKTFFSIVVLLISFGILVLFMTHKTEEKVAILSQLVEKALSNRDQVKLKMIKSAAAQYEADKGYSAPTLDELVGQGYINSRDILDHNGNRLAYTPEGPTSRPGSTMTIMSKSCGKCGNRVSNSSKVGDRCPHCGVIWGVERVTRTY